MQRLLFFILILIASCKPLYQKLDTKRIIKAEVRNPSILRKKCLQSFPPITRYKDSIRIISGKPDTSFTEVHINCDTARITNTITKERIVKVPVPKLITQVDTYYSVATIIEQDTRAIDIYQEKLDTLNETNTKAQQARKTWRTVALACMGFIMLIVGLKFITAKFKLF